MKRIFVYLMVCFNVIRLYSQDFSVIQGGRGEPNTALNYYNESVFEFTNIFSNNALKILLGEVDLLSTRYSRLDIFSLAQLNNQNLRLLRNMIYARHGYIFNSSDLVLYFSRFDWYNPKFDNVDDLLTDIDKYNIQLIQAFENRNENLLNVVLNNPIGVWQDGPIMAAGWSCRFVIHQNNQLEYYFSQMRPIPLILGLNGNYSIKGNVLIYTVSQIYFLVNDSEINYSAGLGYQWGNSAINTLILEKPIVYKFPITSIVTREIYEGLTRETLRIGRDFYRMRNNVNDKF